MRFIYKLLLIVMLFAVGSCSKTIDVEIPVGKYATEAVFANNESAQLAMRGVYATMTNGFATCPFEGVITGLVGLSSDELIRGTYSEDQQLFLDNNLFQSSAGVAGFWNTFYNYIYQANNIYESVEKSAGISQAQKDVLMGEARFIRAINFFYLTNLFGDIPFTVSSDFAVNALLPKSPSATIYAQIIEDLKFAQSKMGNSFTVAVLRYRPNKWAATALLARVYLYQKQWALAEAEATAVINQNTFYKMDLLDNVFLVVSNEAIWNLQNPGVNLYAAEGTSVSGSAVTNASYRLSPYVLSQFKTGDQRMSKWTRVGTGTGLGSTAPSKYKVFSNTQVGAKAEASTILRLAEQYLIRAEARAMQNNLPGAIQDLDVVRTRAGAVGNATQMFQTIQFSNPTINQQGLIDAIYTERTLEFFAEFGHRWFDSKRSAQTLSTFFGTRKPTIEQTDAFYPIPQKDLLNNPNLKQNLGY